MGRYCASCCEYLSRRQFSRNQWMKGPDVSRCISCVGSTRPGPLSRPSLLNDERSRYQTAPTVYFDCSKCDRSFPDRNQLEMHQQSHRERTVSCIVCHDKKFKSPANAVQHVESGYCSGCKGSDNARKQIYQFASQQPAMKSYLTHLPMLEYGDYNTLDDVPDMPYQCKPCGKAYRHLSQLLQHEDQKHRNFLNYY